MLFGIRKMCNYLKLSGAGMSATKCLELELAKTTTD